MCLSIRPDKCFSLVYDGKKARRNVTFKVGNGETQNIHHHPTMFLGATVCSNKRAVVNLASKSFSNHLSACLSQIDKAHIRGKYKVWIFKRYLVPSIHYRLAVEGIKKTEIKKLNALATRLVKRWLGLTRSTTVTVLHHPSVLDIPYLEDFSTKAKLTYLSAVTVSHDPLVEEIASLDLSPHMRSALGSSKATEDVLRWAIDSIESINKRTLPKAVKYIMKERSAEKWNNHLCKLTVQCKFGEACGLEKYNKVWSRILKGLLAGQLSFILRAASDTLSTPLNLENESRCQVCIM